MKLDSKMVTYAVMGIIMIVVMFQAYAVIIPVAQDTGSSLNDSNRCEATSCYWNTTAVECVEQSDNTTECDDSGSSIPLGGLFNGTGVIFVLIMAGLLIVIVNSYIRKQK